MPEYLVALLLLLISLSAAAAPRVITLAPALTEIAFAAGIKPVAVSAWSDYPPEASALEQVANWQGINVERILALKPDLVLAWREGNPRRQVDQLSAFGIKVVWINPTTLDQLAASLRQLKAWSPAPEQADRAADALLQQREQLSRRYASLPEKRVFLQFGLRPLFTASRNTLQSEILQLCGGENVFADSQVDWPQVSREQVLIRKPQIVIMPGGAERVAQVEAFWRPQLAVAVRGINEDWFSRPGPRIMQAAQQLCSQLHPE